VRSTAQAPTQLAGTPSAPPRPPQAVYARRKRALLKKALELSVLCDSEIGIVIFNSSGQLCQYASGDMEQLLGRYSKACAEPHERSANDEVRCAMQPGRGGLGEAALDQLRPCRSPGPLLASGGACLTIRPPMQLLKLFFTPDGYDKSSLDDDQEAGGDQLRPRKRMVRHRGLRAAIARTPEFDCSGRSSSR
jgi:hypothetical protein